MMRTYTVETTAVKSEITNPWLFLDALSRAQEAAPWWERPQAAYLRRFLDLVARQRHQNEPDALLAEGFRVFGYRLSDAVRAVEGRLLERMAALDFEGGPS